VVADGAVQQALEVVVMLAFAGTTQRPRRQQMTESTTGLR
jgi:hypothetical protein